MKAFTGRAGRALAGIVAFKGFSRWWNSLEHKQASPAEPHLVEHKSRAVWLSHGAGAAAQAFFQVAGPWGVTCGQSPVFLQKLPPITSH